VTYFCSFRHWFSQSSRLTMLRSRPTLQTKRASSRRPRWTTRRSSGPASFFLSVCSNSQAQVRGRAAPLHRRRRSLRRRLRQRRSPPSGAFCRPLWQSVSRLIINDRGFRPAANRLSSDRSTSSSTPTRRRLVQARPQPPPGHRRRPTFLGPTFRGRARGPSRLPAPTMAAA
jgi:hypothetical protein